VAQKLRFIGQPEGSSRPAVHDDFIAEQANLGVALDIDGFVFAQPARESLSEFRFAGDESRRVGIFYAGRGGIAGEESGSFHTLISGFSGSRATIEPALLVAKAFH